MNALTGVVARIMYALPFGVFGIMHFINTSDFASYIPSWIPGATFWVYLVGVALLAAAVSLIIEKKTRLACILLGVMLLIFVVTMHIPSVIGGSEASMSNLLKDFALAGAAWYIAGNYENGDGEEPAAPETGGFEG